MRKSVRFLLIVFILILPLIYLSDWYTTNDHSKSISTEELKGHMYFLASDSLQGRLTGSNTYDIASDYAVEQFKQAGLQPICNDSIGNKSFLQIINFDKYELDSNNSITIERMGVKKVFQSPKDYILDGFTGPKKESVTGEAVFVGFGIHEPELDWDDYKDVNIEGKWIVMFKMLTSHYISEFKTKIAGTERSIKDIYKKRIKYIRQHGAKGIIFILKKAQLDKWNDWAQYHHRIEPVNNNKSQIQKKIIPTISANFDFLNTIFEGQQFDPINNKGEYSSFTYKDTKISLNKSYSQTKIMSSNIVSFIEGSDPKLKSEFIITGAHLDHIGIKNGLIMNGADDNASGSSAVFEIAKAVALSKPKRSVIFILFTGEEEGLYGSKYFVENLPVDKDSVQLFINLDMVGRPDGDANQIAPVGYNKSSANLKNILFKANKKSAHMKLDYTYADIFFLLKQSDQYWFYRNGIPVIFLTNGIHKDYHQSTDDAEKIDYEFLRKVCVLSYDLIMEAADSKKSFRK